MSGREFVVDGAALATEEPLEPLAVQGFEYARAFQNRVIEWIRDGSEPVAALRAPTGAGKTATFFDLIRTREMTLLVYPTNALLRQQRERFKDAGLRADVLTGRTLNGHAHERTENLLKRVNSYAADHDVVLTNPDILQAVIQDMYRGGDAMRFFNFFDAIVYDEFHFYGALAATGLLLQCKIVSERSANPKVLLASATPNEDFVDFLESNVALEARDIDASYDPDGDQFRRTVRVRRREADRILDDRDEIAGTLLDEIDAADDLTEPRIVLVFNSAKDSNEFHDYLHREYESVFEHTLKDNGFDTHDDAIDPETTEFFVLNTTSKGEVGLDYDVRTMFMEAPHTASGFLQRFGRAGRQSRATVHVYGLDKGPWGADAPFPEFVDQIYEGLEAQQMETERLADLVGLRAALAVADREDDGWFNQELRADFDDNVDRYARWRGFVAAVNSECNEIQRGFEPGKYPKNSPEAKLLKFTRQSFDVFRGLRGQSVSASIKYPRGDRMGLTTYGLTSTLRHYSIERVESGDVLVLEPDDDDTPSPVTARLPGYETEPTRYGQPNWKIEDQLQTKIHRHIDQVESTEGFEVPTELLHRYFRIIRIVDAIVPTRITTADYEIEVERSESASPSIEVTERNR